MIWVTMAWAGFILFLVKLKGPPTSPWFTPAMAAEIVGTVVFPLGDGVLRSSPRTRLCLGGLEVAKEMISG